MYLRRPSKIDQYIETVLKWFIRKRLLNIYLTKYEAHASGDDYAHWLHTDLVLFVHRCASRNWNDFDDSWFERTTNDIEENPKLRCRLRRYGANSDRTKADLLWFTAYFNRMSSQQACAFEEHVRGKIFEPTSSSTLEEREQQYFKNYAVRKKKLEFSYYMYRKVVCRSRSSFMNPTIV